MTLFSIEMLSVYTLHEKFLRWSIRIGVNMRVSDEGPPRANSFPLLVQIIVSLKLGMPLSTLHVKFSVWFVWANKMFFFVPNIVIFFGSPENIGQMQKYTSLVLYLQGSYWSLNMHSTTIKLCAPFSFPLTYRLLCFFTMN